MLKRHFIAMDGPKVIGIFRLSAEKDKCEVSRDDDFDLNDHRHPRVTITIMVIVMMIMMTI